MKMKRGLALAVLIAVSAAALPAQSWMGIKGNLALNLGSGTEPNLDKHTLEQIFIKDLPNLDLSKENVLVGGGGSIYGGFTIIGILGAQVDFSIMGVNGIRSGDIKFQYNTIDVPVSLTVRIPIGPIHIAALFGPNFSFPFGYLDIYNGNSKITSGKVTSSFIFGLAFGLDLGITLGPGSLVFGTRYVNDFMPVKVEDKDAFYRRSLNFSLGYELKF